MSALEYHEIQRVMRCLEEEKRVRQVHAINPADLVSADVQCLVFGINQQILHDWQIPFTYAQII